MIPQLEDLGHHKIDGHCQLLVLPVVAGFGLQGGGPGSGGGVADERLHKTVVDVVEAAPVLHRPQVVGQHTDGPAPALFKDHSCGAERPLIGGGEGVGAGGQQGHRTEPPDQAPWAGEAGGKKQTLHCVAKVNTVVKTALIDSAVGIALMDHRQDRAGDQIPIFAEVDRHHRLDVQRQAIDVFPGADAIVPIPLERNAD